MKLTILETGHVPEPLFSRFGAYPKMFETMFERAGQSFDIETVRVIDGAPFPEPDEAGAVLLTGSPAGVYEDHPWLSPLRDFIRRAYAGRTPMVGICFGHQIIADALGGEVRKSKKGWGMGRHVYERRASPAPLGELPDTLAIAASHQDQVLAPPREATVIYGSDFAPNAGLFYANGQVLTLQPHPEFTADFAVGLAEFRRGTVVSEEIADKAIASFDKPLDNQWAANWIGRFLSERG
jgi:GMP synthase-like glutamine amidotransferase